MNRRRALAWGGVALGVLVVAATVAAVVVQPWRSPAAGLPVDADEAGTVVAERTTLTADLILNGNLSYGDEITLPGRGGTVTRLPKAGDEIAVGQALYEVDGRPVIAVRGDRPFWRPLSDGIDNGADVQQLEQFLVDAGFGGEVVVDTEFTWTTTAAVKNWQQSLGLEGTGVVGMGDIVAVNAASVRIASVTAKLGDGGGSPLSYTSTVLRAVAKLTDAQAREILPATVVTVTLPDGTELPGTITSIDPGGQPTGKDGETTSPSATVEFDDPTAAQGIGLRAVKVALASAEVKDALVIPVTALVATLDGGYAVDVLSGGEKVRVPVEIGLIADARVQVTGGDLAEGDIVVVAP
ncbi:MAG: HlyD family secretion protein [Microbacteriaceae bacterium]|nr:HlyD family secretion protein [Microbacteriaceae bacterium]